MARDGLGWTAWRRVQWRRVLASGVALAFMAGFVSSADAARYSRTQTANNKRVPPKAPFGELPKGPLQMVVSIGGQHVTLYANGQRIEQAKVSTGTPGHPTPLGVFSVIEKDRYHRSNLYDSAPMFYMHRLTWSGVAMHEGILPGYAASHGCIRMPTGFVSRLWQITKLGVRVVIARNDPVPYEFDHPKLFNPRLRPVAQLSSTEPGEGLRSTASRPVVLAQATVTDAVEPLQPSTQGEAPSQPAEAETTGITPPAQATDAPVAAPAATPAVETPGVEPEKRDPTDAEPRKPASPRNRAGEPTKTSGQVAVFISRREKKIFVRQGFIPLFEMPIEIANPEQALGTHVFTAMELQDGGGRMRWNAISMPAENLSRSVDIRGGKKGRNAEPVVAHDGKPSTAAEALNRIQLPPEAVDRISELLTPGSSMVVSDHGLGRETGRYTEFIVLTQ
jgi:L,D-transpeptidase catalytic domain